MSAFRINFGNGTVSRTFGSYRLVEEEFYATGCGPCEWIEHYCPGSADDPGDWERHYRDLPDTHPSKARREHGFY